MRHGIDGLHVMATEAGTTHGLASAPLTDHADHEFAHLIRGD